MAHPFAADRQHKVEHSRVAHITRGYASGGAVHSDAAADAAQIKKMVKPAALKMDGKAPAHRADRPHRASGGRVKKHKGVNVNVIVAPQNGGTHAAPLPGPAAGAVPVPPQGLPPRPPMPMPPPGAMAGPGAGPMPPPGMPPRNTGGRAYAKGGAVKSGSTWDESRRLGTQVTHDAGKNDQAGLNRGKPVTYKTGGGVAAATRLPGGSGGGEARQAKEKRAERNYKRA